jgi:hypothetical protein
MKIILLPTPGKGLEKSLVTERRISRKREPREGIPGPLFKWRCGCASPPPLDLISATRAALRYRLHHLEDAHSKGLRQNSETASNSRLEVIKLRPGCHSEHLLVLRLFDTRPGFRDIDCKHSEIEGAIISVIREHLAGTTKPGRYGSSPKLRLASPLALSN